MAEVRTAVQLETWVRRANPGDSCVYHEGMTLDHDQKGQRLANRAPAAAAALRASDAGQVALFQEVGGLVKYSKCACERLHWYRTPRPASTTPTWATCARARRHPAAAGATVGRSRAGSTSRPARARPPTAPMGHRRPET